MARKKKSRSKAANLAGKRGYLWIAALVVVLLGVGYVLVARRGIGPALSARPGSAGGMNLLLITLDTVRGDSLGCYGCSDVQTPELDDLAASGVRFSHAIASAPITLPSHATILTGLYPPRHGIRDNGKFKLGENHLSLAERLNQFGYATGAFVGAFVLDERYGLAQGFDTYDDEMSASRRLSGVHGGAPQRPGNIVTDTALGWLTAHIDQTSDVPFFAWVHLFDAHTPYSPPEPFATSYQDKLYLGEVAFVDKQVGRLVDFLRDRSLLDATLIIVAGDHGEGLGEHNEDTHSRLIYDTTMVVPMIWHCPKLLGAPAVVSDRVVSLADITPTVLDLLNLDVPTTLDGLSLLNRRPPENRVVYIETLAPQLNHGWSPLFGLRRLGDKFIEAPTPEYYDVATDPKELANDYSPSHPEATALEKALSDLRAKLEVNADDDDSLAPADGDALRKLAALGYVATPMGTTRGAPADPKDMMLLSRKFLNALKLSNSGRFAESVAVYREILSDSPEDPTAWSGLSRALGQQGRNDEAIQAILKATQLQPDQRHWISLARLQMEKGDDEACRASLEQAAKVVPGDGEIPLIQGERLMRGQQYEAAIRCFEEARQIDPSRVSVSAYVNTGRALVEIGKLDEARAAYDEALFCDPNDVRALDELSDLHERTEKFDAALAARQRLHQLRPASMLYANKLSALYFKLDRPDDAIATLQALVARQPTNPAASGNLANALSLAGHVKQAISVYRQALELQPKYVIGRYNLAGALQQTGDLEGAIQQCRAALRFQADFGPARNRLLVLLTETSQIDEALAELEGAALHGFIDWSELMADPRLEALVKDPRFAQLRKRLEEQP